MDDPQERNPFLSEEPLANYLKRRERELMQQTAALRSLLAPKEKELEEVRQAMKAVGVQPGYVEQLAPFLDGAVQNASPYAGILNMVETLTIKEMIVGALNHHFHQGATPSELSEYMRTAYGREVDRNSISPQLARLREEGLVQNTNALNESGKWQLSVRGSLVEAANEVERQNVNALAPSPRAKRWYGPKKD
jgi:hypothetical protein